MTDRIRKAWRVQIKGFHAVDIVFAPTAEKARYQTILGADGDPESSDIIVHRAPECDVKLPQRHELADRLSAKQTASLLHAFGVDLYCPEKAGHRNYFCTNRNDQDLCALQNLGLMNPLKQDQWGDGITYFIMTELGKQVALSLVPEYAL